MYYIYGSQWLFLFSSSIPPVCVARRNRATWLAAADGSRIITKYTLDTRSQALILVYYLLLQLQRTESVMSKLSNLDFPRRQYCEYATSFHRRLRVLLRVHALEVG